MCVSFFTTHVYYLMIVFKSQSPPKQRKRKKKELLRTVLGTFIVSLFATSCVTNWLSGNFATKDNWLTVWFPLVEMC